MNHDRPPGTTAFVERGEDAARRRLEEAEGLERACLNSPDVVRNAARIDREFAEAHLAEWTA